MFNRGFFADMRRAGLHTGVSRNKLSKIMLDILQQLPERTPNPKEAIVARMGLLGQMSATRDINAAWEMAKKQAAREYPATFLLDSRKGLHWASEAPKILDKKISAKNIKMLNELAEKAGCTVDQMVDTLIRGHKARASR